MDHVVLLCTAWGPKLGGVNAFNTDLAKALGPLLSPRVRVSCIVPDATADEVEEARRANVVLIPIGAGVDPHAFSVARSQDVIAALQAQPGELPVSWWVGHDIITGELAVHLCTATAQGHSALIHHMSYIDYFAYKHGVGQAAKRKFDEQHRVFRTADRVFAVGPLLRDRLSDMLGQSQRVVMLVPGLAEIEPLELPHTFTAITFGRLDPENDRIKQGRLAVAGFSAACREAHRQPALSKALQQARMKVIGLAEPGGSEEKSLHTLADEKADRVFPLIALPFDENRAVVFDELRKSSVAMMLSWHEGFGLVGWEAVAAEVPLIVSRNSGVHQMVAELLGGAGTGCLKVVDVRGQLADEGEENFRQQDEDDVRQAVIEIAAEAAEWKRNAKLLRTLLSEGPDACTWRNTAKSLAGALQLLGQDEDALPAVQPTNAAPATAPPADTVTDLLEHPISRWRPGAGLAESQLLRPEEACVPFHESRRALLLEVLAWANTSAPPVTLQLRTGAGGAGKTRLMLEVCRQLVADGWQAGFLVSGVELNWKLCRKLLTKNPHTFIVVDYAETRRAQVAELVSAALSLGTERRVRIALLARDAGEWWTQLPTAFPALDSFFTGSAVSGPYRLPSVSEQAQERQSVFVEALSAFATRLNRASDGIVPPDLSAAHFGEVLFVHLSALAALAGERADTATGLLDATLRRERRYWHQAATAADLPLDAHGGLDQAMALVTLFNGTRNTAETRQLLADVPRLRDLTQSERERAFRVLRQFYPREGGVDALRPDILGERLVAQELSKDDELLEIALGSDATDDRARMALTVLTFLARRSAADTLWLRRALERNLTKRARTAIQVAIDTGDPVGIVLADVLAAAPIETRRSVANVLHQQIPAETIALSELALVVARLRVESVRLKETKGAKKSLELAAALSNLGYRQRQLGHYAEALDAYIEAKRVMEGFDKSRAENRANAAGILVNIAMCHHDLGKFEDAVTLCEEAVGIYQQLAREADVFRRDLAKALTDSSVALRSMGRYEKARLAAEKAVDILRAVEAAHAGTVRAELSQTLANLSALLDDIGRYDEAVTLSQEALAIAEELAAAKPDSYRMDLAQIMGNFATSLSSTGRYEEALHSGEQAAAIVRDLAARRPDMFRVKLAGFLNNQANRLNQDSRFLDAARTSQEAVEIMRQLSPQQSDRSRDDLAMSLSNHALNLRALGQFEQALELTRESLHIEQELALTRPDALRGHQAISIGNIAYLLADLGRYAEGLAEAERALALYQVELGRRPRVFRSHTAYARCAMARCLEGLEARTEAGAAANEGLRALVEDLTELHRRPDSSERDVLAHLVRIAAATADADVVTTAKQILERPAPSPGAQSS